MFTEITQIAGAVTVVGLEDGLRISFFFSNFWHNIQIGFGAHVISHVVGTGITFLVRMKEFWNVTPHVQTGPGAHSTSY
jgi:hypothetical protein